MEPQASRRDVPTVAFYGEAGDWSTAALLHSEPLFERSRMHAWRIRPHRHNNLVQLFWLSRGHGTARFDAEARELAAPCIAVIPERCVHEFDWSEESAGFAISLESTLVQELHSQLGLADEAFRHAGVLEAADDAGYLDMLFRHIQAEYSGEAELHEAALDSLIRALAVWIARQAPAGFALTAPASRGSIHFGRFAQLLDRHHKEHWNVTDYAGSLGVSPSHLNTICREHGGASAQRLIHFLGIQTSSGRLYEIDTRLRPSGESGLMVTSMEAFKRYQRKEAWVWEHQALLRSRSVAGSEAVRRDFEVDRDEGWGIQPSD